MISREGYPTIALTLLVTVLIGWPVGWFPPAAATAVQFMMLLLFVLVVYFFRDPERSTPEGDNLVISPADGKVVQIRQVEEKSYIGGPATRVSIFLSPLDVHVNRVPVNGKLEYVSYFPGVYLMAWQENASELNEQAHFGVRHPDGIRILFKQITGFLARRIVYNISEGDSLKAGERFGIMKFGSRMDLLLPPEVRITVKEGDRTVAGESVVGVIDS